jgi:hypothetical protein
MYRVVMMVLGATLLLSACGSDAPADESPDSSVAPARVDATASGDSVEPQPQSDTEGAVGDTSPSTANDITAPTGGDAPPVMDALTDDAQGSDAEAGIDSALGPADIAAEDADEGGDVAVDGVDSAVSSCPEADPIAEAVFAACTQVHAAVEAEAADLFPDYAAPALMTLTDQAPVEAPEVCISEELPQSTEGTCQPLTAQFKLDMFTKLSSGELEMPPTPEAFNPFQAGKYTFAADQCANRAIQNAGTLLTFHGGCTDGGACCPNAALDWVSLRGVVVGAQLFGERMAEQLEEEGLAAAYPPPTGEVPICQNTALVSLASEAALGDVDKAAGTTPMCPGFAPDGVAEVIGFTAQQTQYVAAIKQGVNAEAALFSARLMGEGPCCLVSL